MGVELYLAKSSMFANLTHTDITLLQEVEALCLAHSKYIIVNNQQLQVYIAKASL